MLVFLFFFLLLPSSITNNAVLLSHNCLLAPSAHSSAVVSQAGCSKGLNLIWLMLSMANLALFSDVSRLTLQGKKDVTSSNRRGSVLEDTGISIRNSIFFEQRWSPRHARPGANGEALHPGNNLPGNLETFFVLYMLSLQWGVFVQPVRDRPRQKPHNCRMTNLGNVYRCIQTSQFWPKFYLHKDQ